MVRLGPHPDDGSMVPRHVGVDDRHVRAGRSDQVKQLVAAQRVVEESEAEHHVDTRLLAGHHVEHIASEETKPFFSHAVLAEGLSSTCDEIIPSFDADDVSGSRLDRGEAPTPIVAGYVEHPGARDDIQVFPKIAWCRRFSRTASGLVRLVS
jgi:hypothetical protein